MQENVSIAVELHVSQNTEGKKASLGTYYSRPWWSICKGVAIETQHPNRAVHKPTTRCQQLDMFSPSTVSSVPLQTTNYC